MRAGDSRDRFVFTDGVAEKRLQMFMTLVDTIRQKEIKIVVFLPPFSHPVYQELDQNPNQQFFFRQFQHAVESLCIEREILFMNFSDLTLFGADEETIDGFHGSDRAYAKIALQMYQAGIMKTNINAQMIENMLATSNDPIYLPQVRP